MAYPTALDNLSTLTGSESMTTHSSLHNEERDAIDALQAKVGVDSSAVSTSLDYLVKNASSSNPGHKHTLAHGATDVTASAAELNVLDGIPGTLTATELGYVDGVTSAIQTQLNAKVALAGTQEVTGDKTFSGDVTFTGTVTGAGAATWTAFSGAYASGTTLTVAGTDVTGIMKKGVILKWLSSADAFKTGMVVSSSFSTDTTITIVGSTAASGDKSFYYGPFANSEVFIIPGTLAAGTDIAKTWYTPDAIYPISCDARVKTAGTTNATEFDINDDGTSIFGGTAASIASAGTADLNNVSAAPTTAVAQNSLITVDINSVSTTAPVEAYIEFFYYPVSLTSRT